MRQAIGKTKEVEAPSSWSWVIDINRRLLNGEYSNTYADDDQGGNLARIDKYPAEGFRRIQADAFLPELVSIGRSFICKDTEVHKQRLLVRLLRGRNKKKSEEKLLDESSSSRFNNNDDEAGRRRKLKLEDLVEAMRLVEEKTRACYNNSDSVTIRSSGCKDYGVDAPISSERFVERMVLDGCFVIEVLRLHWHLRHSSSKAGVAVEDPIFRSSSTRQHLQRDFLVLGNQLPFFVLKELYSLTRSDENTSEPPLGCLAIDFLRDLLAGEEDAAAVSLLKDDPRADNCHHLLHLFSYACINRRHRYLNLPDVLEKEDHKVVPLSRATKLAYNVGALQEAGVRIKPKPPTEDGLMAIDTFKGTLRIQPFYFDNNFVFMLRHFLAFEQCHPHEANPYFTSYIMFLDSLIDSEADVEVLHKVGVLNHGYGNNRDVAGIIYKLARNIDEPNYNNFRCEIMELNGYCKAYYGSKWRPWWRNLVNNYFSSPWTVTSLVAATILLILTFVQTFYTTYAYYKPPL